MRKILLSLTAASAIVAAASIAPASAMTVGTASGIQAAIIDGTSAVQDVAYVCRHRYWNSRRVCWWTHRYYRRW
jgi:phage terminase large subunit-like protein